MEYITIKDEFIKLGQAMKLAGLVGSGIDAKMVIQNGEVTVNGEVDERRGRKLYPGDVFEYDGHKVEVKQKLIQKEYTRNKKTSQEIRSYVYQFRGIKKLSKL